MQPTGPSVRSGARRSIRSMGISAGVDGNGNPVILVSESGHHTIRVSLAVRDLDPFGGFRPWERSGTVERRAGRGHRGGRNHLRSRLREQPRRRVQSHGNTVGCVGRERQRPAEPHASLRCRPRSRGERLRRRFEQLHPQVHTIWRLPRRLRRAGGWRRTVPDAQTGGSSRPLAGRPRGRSVDLQDRDLQPGGGLDRPARRERPRQRLLQRAVRPRSGPAASVRRGHGESAGPAILVRRSLRVPAHLGQPRLGRGEPRVQLGPGRHDRFERGIEVPVGGRDQEQPLHGVLARRHRDRARVRETGFGVGQFDWPFAVVAMGPDVIVADTRNDRVQRWVPAGPGLEWTTGSGGGVSINAPKDVAVSGGDVYVAYGSNRRVLVLSGTTGAFLRHFGGSSVHQAEGFVVEPNGDVWVADTSWNRLLRVLPEREPAPGVRSARGPATRRSTNPRIWKRSRRRRTCSCSSWTRGTTACRSTTSNYLKGQPWGVEGNERVVYCRGGPGRCAHRRSRDCADDRPRRSTTQTFTGSIAAGGASWKQHLFSVVDAGQIQATLDWDDPAANLNLFLYRMEAGGTWTEVARSLSTTAKPEQVTYASGTVGQWKVGIKAVSGYHGLYGERDPLTERDPSAHLDRLVLRIVRLQRTRRELRVRRRLGPVPEHDPVGGLLELPGPSDTRSPVKNARPASVTAARSS